MHLLTRNTWIAVVFSCWTANQVSSFVQPPNLVPSTTSSSSCAATEKDGAVSLQGSLPATTSSSCSSPPPYLDYYPATFSMQETSDIIDVIKEQVSSQTDDREDRAKRTNYYDYTDRCRRPDSPYLWFLERIRQHAFPHYSLDEFQSHIEFVLLHEFDETGFFDWHVDSGLPNEANPTNRTRNINVMLSQQGVSHEGGDFCIGQHWLSPQRGDLYTYPPAVPHKVTEITRGRRHTLVVSLQEQPFFPKPYWQQAEDVYKLICRDSRQAKIHMLYGKFLHALNRPFGQIDAAFAAAYACSPQAASHVTRFEHLAQEQEEQGQAEAAASFANMAHLIRTKHEDYLRQQQQEEEVSSASGSPTDKLLSELIQLKP